MSTRSDTSEGLPIEFCNYSHVISMPAYALCESSTGSPDSQLINSSRLMLDGSNLAPKPYFDIHDSSKHHQKALRNWSLAHQGLKRKIIQCLHHNICSLKKRLSNRTSSSVQHVHSVLRLSFSDSFSQAYPGNQAGYLEKVWDCRYDLKKNHCSNEASTGFPKMNWNFGTTSSTSLNYYPHRI